MNQAPAIPRSNVFSDSLMTGTMGYMPPEAVDRAELSTAQDMWALGTILYEIMFGFSPFLPHELHMPVLAVPFPGGSSPSLGGILLVGVRDESVAMRGARRQMKPVVGCHGWSERGDDA